jgi:hypothetical protein
MRKGNHCRCCCGSGLFFASRLDDPNRLEFSDKIRLCALAISRPSERRDAHELELICPSGSLEGTVLFFDPVARRWRGQRQSVAPDHPTVTPLL